jgi:glycosyltransferase involved in cell wall biosynthesis
MPKVSVLMPVYKTEEKYLREAVESILAQTFTDFEFLILDDCPEDTREDIIKSYKDKRITYKKNPQNLGISESRNKLLDLAKGKYLAIFDHDDISMPNRLEREVAYLDAHPEVGLVSALYQTFPKLTVHKAPENDADIRLSSVERCCVSHSCCMIRKSVLNEHHIRYEAEFSPAEDYRLFCRLLEVSKLHNLQEVLLNYRLYKSNTSKLQDDKMHIATWKIRAINRTRHPEIYAEYLMRATFTNTISLFGIIPLFKITKQDCYTKIYLFEKILILKIRSRNRISKKK